MSIVLELPSEVEERLRGYAAYEGHDVNDLLRRAVEEITAKPLTKVWTAAELIELPLSERETIMERLFDAAAPLYNADLALPPAERELTAFTALDGVDPILDDYEVEPYGNTTD